MPKPVQGQYYGRDIFKGTDAEVMSQMAVIDAERNAGNEPAVLSTASGKRNFESNIQPKLDRANRNVLTADERRRAAEEARAKLNTEDDIPDDVLDEMEEGRSPEDKLLKERLDLFDEQADDLRSIYGGLTLASNRANQANVGVLTSQWQERRRLLQQSNRQNVANWTQQFMRFGQAEYSPGMTSDMITEKETEGARKVKALDDDYNAAVAAANAALEEKNFLRAANLAKEIAAIEEKALAAVEANVKESRLVNDKLRESRIQASRDGAVGSLVSQGITEPAVLLEMLNYYDDGTPTGGDFTADEISKVLKALAVDGDEKNLSTDLQTFQYIRDSVGLPPEIAGLPPEQQYFAYLSRIKGTGQFTLSPGQIRYGEDGKPIAYGAPRESDKEDEEEDVPTYEEYRAAALKAAGVNYFMAAEEAQLRAQYDAEYGGEAFTPTEKKKLEQAGLSNATRKQQLDYLYGKKGSESTEMSDDEFLKRLE